MKTKYFTIGAVLIFLLAIGVTWAMAQEDGAVLICAAKDGALRYIVDPAECKEKEMILQMYTAGAVDAKFAAVQERLDALEAENAALSSRVDELEDLLQHFSREGDEIYITGANLHVVNGEGKTEITNSLGNVIIGYNESRYPDPDIRTGSHMLVVGNANNYSTFGGVVVGYNNTTDGWYSTRYDSTHGLMWTTNHKPTFKAIIGRAFHNLVCIYIGEQLSNTDAKTAATDARTKALNAYTGFSGNAFDLDPWIMTGFLLDKLGNDLTWTKQLWDILPATYEAPTDTTPGDAFGQMVQSFLVDGVRDGSLPYETRKHWYENIASVQAGAIDAVTGADIYTSLKAIADYPTVDSVYNTSKAVFLNLVDVEKENPGIVADFRLEQNYPNPFNPSTKIAFKLPESARTTVKIFDVLGREVTELLNEELAAGSYEINWNASALSAGVYFYRVQSGNYIATKKAILLK